MLPQRNGQAEPGVVSPDGKEQEHSASTPARAAPQDEEDERTSESAERITLAQVRDLARAGERVVLVDARTERTFDGSEQVAKGSVRLNPNATMLAEQAREARLPKDAWLAIFCA
jgi:hypothetical protein